MDTKELPESLSLVPLFKLDKILNQDRGDLRIVLYGSISEKPAILIAERTAFPTSREDLAALPESLLHVRNLGDNDIYRWYLASSRPAPQCPDIKLNLIFPCTDAHVKKYSRQGTRMVTETPQTYASNIRPYMQRKREEGRLNWVWNIIEGRTEQEDVLYKETGEEGFLVLPDLNWDRKTMTSLHLLGLMERRDIWSVRDLKKKHIGWLKHMHTKIMDATIKMYPELERDQLKLYVHYQPTYYHFHVHVVHVALEAGATQATGKALGLDNIISQLERMAGRDESGMADVSLTYFIGEASELWTDVFLPLKEASSAQRD
ncbi:MAG: hypothetical protein M1824_001614 [Vezdaea acicularis]|nr:MAG: hypothetical protein M1824_001614 [Vezdaea acicularis]